MATLLIDMLQEIGVNVQPATEEIELLDYDFEYPHERIQATLRAAGLDELYREITLDPDGVYRTTCTLDGFEVSNSKPALVTWRGLWGWQVKDHNARIERARAALVAAGYTVTVQGKRKHFLVVV